MPRAILILLALCGLADAEPTVRVSAGALIAKVDGATATLAKGKRAGLHVGDTGELFGQHDNAFDFNVRLARGKVVALTDDTATLALSAQAQPVPAGAYFEYDVSVPKSLADSALFQITARGIELTAQSADHPFISLEQLLADPSPGLRDATLDLMIADVVSIRDVITGSLPDPMKDGNYHGKTAGQIIDGLDRAQLEAFLRFVDAFPGKYLGHRYKLPEVFFTWVVSKTPSGEREHQLRAAASDIRAARTAVFAGNLDEARAIYKRVLVQLPDHPDATKAIAQIDRLLLLARVVAADPDDTASTYKLADALLDAGAYPLVGERLAALVKRKYEPRRVEVLRALLLYRQEKFADAERGYAALLKQYPGDAEIADLLVMSRARATSARDPKDAAPYLALAEREAKAKRWDAAVTFYRRALDAAHATPAQREAANQGQARMSSQKASAQGVAWTKEGIATHDFDTIRKHVDNVDIDAVDALADQARMAEEEQLSIELCNRQIRERPDSMDARASLANTLLQFEHLEDAQAAATAALERKGGDVAYVHILLARIARARGDLATMEQQATRATDGHPKYPWPLLELARGAAARGDWDAALVQAKKAWELDKGTYDMQIVLAAVNLGQRAAEALKADPSAARERLRLVRAYARLGLVKRAGEEVEKLPAAGRADGWWAIVESPERELQLADRIAAARNAAPSTGRRKRVLAALEARGALRAHPTDDALRIAVARQAIVEGSFDRALATLQPVIAKPGGLELIRDARAGLDGIAQAEVLSAALDRNDFASGLALAVTLQQLHDRLGTEHGRIVMREHRARALAGLHRTGEAAGLLDEARALAVALDEPSQLAITEVFIGEIRSSVGTSEPLRKALELSRSTCEARDDELDCYYAIARLARLENDDGRSARALEDARRAWTTAERVGHAELARDARFLLSDYSLTSNHLGDAEQLAKGVLADSRAANDVKNEQLSLMVLGAVAMMRADGKAARVRFQEVYDLGLRTGDTSWRALARRFEGGSLLDADHDPAKALVALEQAAELYRALGDGWPEGQLEAVLFQIVDARLQLGKRDDARKAAVEAHAIADKLQGADDLARAKLMLAEVALAEKRGDEAAAQVQAALALAKNADDDNLIWNAWYAAARAAELQGKDDVAVDAYEHALEAVGRMLQAAGGDADRNGYFGTGHVRELYTAAVDRLLKVGKTQRAMEVLDLSRDALLKQKFDATKVQPKDPAVRAKLDKADQTRAHVVGLQKQLQQATNPAQQKAIGEQIARSRQELNQVVLDLKVGHRQLFQALAMDPQNLVGRRADLPKGSVLVEYFVAEDALYAFVVSAALAQPAVVKVAVGGAELEKTVSQWRAAIIKQKADALGAKLGDWLLAPLVPHLAGATTLIVLPFGPLYYVPFDALIIDGHYAIEDYRFAMETASTLEHVLRPARPHGTGTLLAISNPDGSLPGAQAEVARIVKSAVPDARVLVRKEATVEKFRELAGSYRFLHLATHGILDADPRKTYLKLSNGPLTVEQIVQLQGLDQGNEMVVLSACDTAMEEGKSTGDELVSVASGFSMAGAPALIASLWAVSDESTAELMTSFYKAIDQAQGDRLDALRAAKLALLHGKAYTAPWHWAAFQLYGDFR